MGGSSLGGTDPRVVGSDAATSGPISVGKPSATGTGEPAVKPASTGSTTKETTYDPILKTHEISDSALVELINMSSDKSWDIFLTCVGALVGTIQNVIKVIVAVHVGTPVGVADLVFSGAFVLALGIGGTSIFFWKSDKRDVSARLKEIRERPKKQEEVAG